MDLISRTVITLMGNCGPFYLVLEISLCVLVSTFPIIIGFVFFFHKRREHVRTGSLKSSHQTQTCNLLARGVSTHTHFSIFFFPLFLWLILHPAYIPGWYCYVPSNILVNWSIFFFFSFFFLGIFFFLVGCLNLFCICSTRFPQLLPLPSISFHLQ